MMAQGTEAAQTLLQRAGNTATDTRCAASTSEARRRGCGLAVDYDGIDEAAVVVEL